MNIPHRTILSPDVATRLQFLDNLGENRFESYLEAISWPGSSFFIRVNTYKSSREDLIELLHDRHPEWSYEPVEGVPEAIRILVRGPIRIEPLDPWVEVDKYAGEAIAMSAPLFAPGFKYTPKRFKEGTLVSMKHTFKASWNKHIKEEFHCGNGLAAFPSNEMHERTRGIVVETTEAWYQTPSIHTWKEYQDGLFIDQNMPSIIATRVLSPKPGSFFLDVCSGAGGKTSHGAQMMANLGLIVAVDRSKKKITELSRRMDTMGFTSIIPFARTTSHIKDILGCIPGTRERKEPTHVLIDPPCSALGLRMKFYVDLSSRLLDDFKNNQIRIWRHVAESIMPGTKIVYCTCTVTLEENEQVIQHVVDEHGFKILDAHAGLSIKAQGGFETEKLSRQDARKFIRFFPDVDDTIGFFIALLEA